MTQIRGQYSVEGFLNSAVKYAVKRRVEIRCCRSYGMGLATSLSYILQFATVMIHFVAKSSYFALSLKGFEVKQLPEMIKAASPIFVKKAAGDSQENIPKQNEFVCRAHHSGNSSAVNTE